MPPDTPLTIVNVGYRATSYWVVSAGASRLLDDESAFIGDLPPEALAFDNPTAPATWQRRREHSARQIYPAHGPIRPMEDDHER